MSDTEQRAIFIFPGQGSQYQGIGSDLCAEFPSARRIYEQASDVLGYDMARQHPCSPLPLPVTAWASTAPW